MTRVPSPRSPRRGDLVRVRTREEILATLDERGQLEGMPFMPEMLEACGRVFRVEARAHKTCDTIQKTGGRRMNEAVHLEGLRCDGSAHGGCQAGCLFFFKNAWLEQVDGPDAGRSDSPASDARTTVPFDDAKLRAGTRAVPATTPDGEPVYVCQTTEIHRATTLLPWWDVRQYVEDVTSGNVGFFDLMNRLFFRLTANAILHLPGYRFWLAIYDGVQRLIGGKPFPDMQGKLKKTPSDALGLRPGDRVKVKSLAEIEKTLDVRNRNRGLAFDKEQSRFCGERHVVHSRVTQIIDEPTGRMVKFPNECIVLEDVACRACYSEKRIGCPRAIYSYWRECWLERVEPERG